jgi:2-phosphosulfolactate phosphatase
VRVDVLLMPQEITQQDVAGRVVAIIDVLRWSTTVAAALHNGARNVIPFEDPEEVVRRSKDFEKGTVKIAGERKLNAIPGFDLGNSPGDFSAEAVGGKTVLMTTTNGTKALLAVQGARDVVIASYVNFSAALAMLRAAARGGTDIALVCGGRDRHFSLEDAACAGRFVRHITRRLANAEIGDAARSCSVLERKYGDELLRLFNDSEHGRALVAGGFERDLETCAQIDSFPVLPVYQERQITRVGPDRER